MDNSINICIKCGTVIGHIYNAAPLCPVCARENEPMPKEQKRDSVEVKYENHKDLPGILKDEAGNNIMIHGYIHQAQEEAQGGVLLMVAEEFMNRALQMADRLKGAHWTNKWMEYALKIRTGK